MKYLFIILLLITYSFSWPAFENTDSTKDNKSNTIVDETKQKTSLHIAIETNKSIFDIIEIVNKGADLKSIDKYGNTPLHYASIRGDLEIIEFLVQKGANIKAKNFIGLTPLDSAIENANLEAFKLLLKLLQDERWINE